ncbi:hypothetical protein BGX23_002108 [Mortierella sp. AD031]|nr:hypothetical protein BGX23_002108 [Mortierella sp. AD031]
MVKTLSLVLLGLLAAIGSAAPLQCPDPASFSQKVFGSTHGNGIRIHDRPSTPVFADGDTGIIYLSPDRTHSRTDLNARMQRIIENDIGISYRAGDYLDALKEYICTHPYPGQSYRLVDCNIDVLSAPVIKVIPAKRLSKTLDCPNDSCSIGFTESVSVSTTHSVETGISMGTSATPFGLGVSFTNSLGYGYSQTKEESVALDFTFNLLRGEAGYIAMANVQISAKLRVRGCRCHPLCVDSSCRSHCHPGSDNLVDEVGHHEKVVTEDNVPAGIVSFVFIDL